jgi:hypothetical protein
LKYSILLRGYGDHEGERTPLKLHIPRMFVFANRGGFAYYVSRLTRVPALAPLRFESPQKAKTKKALLLFCSRAFLVWRPQGDSNPRRRRERAVSWARLDDRDL